jgi:hypothetical protein
MTSGFAQLSNILYLQTMPGISTIEKRKLRTDNRQLPIDKFKMLALSSNQSLALAERSTSIAFQDYL